MKFYGGFNRAHTPHALRVGSFSCCNDRVVSHHPNRVWYTHDNVRIVDHEKYILLVLDTIITHMTSVTSMTSMPSMPSMAIDTHTIRELVQQVRRESYNDSFDSLKSKPTFHKFATEYPVLFRCACDAQFSLSHLEFMLDKLNAVHTSRLTSENAQQDVFNRLNDAYVPVPVPADD